ncbi:Cation efflux family protein [Verticillium dahliae VDG2]|nr:Cation efflux family protein [Verticillium dahliae VDG2]
MANLNENGIPPFESLPLGENDPPFSAWGLYGQSDELGTLNRLTDERVAAAARDEIRTGVRVSLNWPLDAQSQGTFFSRAAFHQDMIQKAPRFINDDVWTFNSQSSSQWDGLRHYGYQQARRFYNGVTMEQDQEVRACLAAQGTEDELQALQAKLPHTFGGLRQGEDTLRWIWENFSAVAGDQPSFECWPTKLDYAMHEVLLAGWGCPIGELFDLEALAAHCRKVGRWSFFVASEVCNVPGGVASPPNILAIF